MIRKLTIVMIILAVIHLVIMFDITNSGYSYWFRGGYAQLFPWLSLGSIIPQLELRPFWQVVVLTIIGCVLLYLAMRHARMFRQTRKYLALVFTCGELMVSLLFIFMSGQFVSAGGDRVRQHFSFFTVSSSACDRVYLDKHCEGYKDSYSRTLGAYSIVHQSGCYFNQFYDSSQDGWFLRTYTPPGGEPMTVIKGFGPVFNLSHEREVLEPLIDAY